MKSTYMLCKGVGSGNVKSDIENSIYRYSAPPPLPVSVSNEGYEWEVLVRIWRVWTFAGINKKLLNYHSKMITNMSLTPHGKHICFAKALKVKMLRVILNIVFRGIVPPPPPS